MNTNNTEWQPVPTEKHPAIEAFLSRLIEKKRMESISDRVCVFCNEKQDLDSFKSELDLKEFHISGICPTCFAETTKE